MPFKGVLKYIIYSFIGGWLFLLGVMAGRGTSPVTFETQGFQERLQTIVEQYKDPEMTGDPDEKIVLHYYDALSDDKGFDEMTIPVPAADSADTADSFDGIPLQKYDFKETDAIDPKDSDLMDDIPVKTSKKAATFNKPVAEKQVDPPLQDEKTPASGEKPEKSNSQGRYTIQVAAFKSFRDAVTQMTTLEKKGFTATRTTKEMDGITWYRIRIGEFVSRDAAVQYLEKLNQAGINGMIITKE
jgi:cell division septation protein DedD